MDMLFRLLRVGANGSRLGPLEQRILRALWRLGGVAVQELIDGDQMPLAYTIVATTPELCLTTISKRPPGTRSHDQNPMSLFDCKDSLSSWSESQSHRYAFGPFQARGFSAFRGYGGTLGSFRRRGVRSGGAVHQLDAVTSRGRFPGDEPGVAPASLFLATDAF
jgi:hypothetical protein